MMRKRVLMASVSVLLALGGCTSTRRFVAQDYSLPDRPVTILVMRPDVEVGTLNVGGTTEMNADWTTAARDQLAIALAANARAKGNAAHPLPVQTGEAARVVADYEFLHRAVARSIARFKYGSESLPTKTRRTFDWTLGPGVQRIAALDPTIGTGDYALFLYTRDAFATSGRKAMQVAGLLGCAVGLCFLPGGGQHFAYASLVDLRSGDVVWFNVLDGSAGDIREAAGAQAMVDRIMASIPARGGAAPAPTSESAAR